MRAPWVVFPLPWVSAESSKVWRQSVLLTLCFAKWEPYGVEEPDALLITRVVDNSELLRIDAQPDALYPMAVEKVLQDIRKINDQAQAQQGDNFKAVQYETAMWNDDIRIQLQTEVIYRSEYHDQLIIPIQHSDKIVKKEEAVISKLLDSLKGYGPQQLALYRREHSFLQP